jgi:hypothetical protein
MGSGGQADGRRLSPVTPGFDELQRIGTNGTMEGSISSKSEKRRSGFFGLGGKKDKNKEQSVQQEVSDNYLGPQTQRGLCVAVG